MTHKEIIRERKQERQGKGNENAGKPLSPEFLAKWWTLVEVEKQKAVQARETLQRAQNAVCVPLCVEEGTGLEDWVETARRPKVGLKPAITCHCGRTVVPGTRHCWRHIGETK